MISARISKTLYRFTAITLSVALLLQSSPVMAGPNPEWTRQSASRPRQVTSAPRNDLAADGLAVQPVAAPRATLAAEVTTPEAFLVSYSNLAVEQLDVQTPMAQPAPYAFDSYIDAIAPAPATPVPAVAKTYLDIPEELLPPVPNDISTQYRRAPKVPGRAAPIAMASVGLVPGWNLVSLPEIPPDADPAAVLASIAGNYNLVYAYDGCDPVDPWKLYDPNADPVANDLLAIDHTMGFWIEMTTADTLQIDGTTPTDTDIPICTGWNLVGYPQDRTFPIGGALSAIAGQYSRVFAHEATTPDEPWDAFDTTVPNWVNDLQFMQPGKGYWVLATSDATLAYTAPPAPPIVAFDVLTDGTEIFSPIYITGTITSTVDVQWTMQYRAEGESAWIDFDGGNAVGGASGSQVVGEFDPTLLLNDIYEVRTVATDIYGQSGEVMRDVLVSGDMKVGLFTVSFIDLDVPVVGVPIQFIRTYDSRNKTSGEFGIGWTLDVRRGTYKNNRVPGDGWIVDDSDATFPCTGQPEPTKYHVTEVRFSDKEYYRFEPVFQVEQPTLGGCLGIIRFEQISGSFGASLESLSPIDVFWDAGPQQLLDIDTGEPWEPSRVRLIKPNGTQYEFTAAEGLVEISDLNGNTLEINRNSISHSSGKSISVFRDELDRITSIVDPMGERISYLYDDSSDLVTLFDQSDNATHFTYNRTHGLLDIRDPNGIARIRNEYDVDGRLKAVVDADGNRTEFTHNINERSEVVQNGRGGVTVYQYDDRGNIVSQTDPLGNVSEFAYDGRDNISSVTDAMGHTTTMSYDIRDNLLSITNPLGHTSSFTYNNYNQILTSTDPLGNIVTNSYDSFGNLIAITDSLGNSETYTHDSNGNVTSVTDGLGKTTLFQFNNSGNVTSLIDPLGQQMLYTYDAIGNLLSRMSTRTDEHGNSISVVTRVAHDSQNRLIQSTDAEGGSAFLEYDQHGEISVITDKNGNQILRESDARGNPNRTIYPDGTVESTTYDANRNVTSFTDRGGKTTIFYYDLADRLVQIQYPDGNTESIEYDLLGNQIAVVDQQGNRTEFEYDAAGRMIRRIDATGKPTVFSHDANGNVVSTTDSNGITTLFEYDTLNRLSRTVFADGTSTSSAYDSLGRVTSQTDQAGNVTEFQYDALERLIKVIDALGNETTYVYDEVGNRIRQIDAKGQVTLFDYDNVGRVIGRTLPLGMRETFLYDANGNTLAHTDFNGQTTTFTYDANDRMHSKVFPDGSIVEYSYTPVGLTNTASGPNGMISYTYDNRDRVQEVVREDGSAINYAYGPNGRITSVIAPSGAIEYTYDELDRLVSVTDSTMGVTSYIYDNVGNPLTSTFPNGSFINYSYDNLNRLNAVVNYSSSGDVISSYSYDLHPTGKRISVVENTDRQVNYTYDAAFRLLQEEIIDPLGSRRHIDYTYDAVGNRLSKETEGSSVSYSYDANDRLVAENDITYLYDDNGNTLNRYSDGDVTSYSYDYENRLVNASSSSMAVNYLYDAEGIRIAESVNGNTIKFLVDNNRPYSQVLEERTESGSLVAQYVYGEQLISQTRSGSPYYYLTDGLGSTRGLTDASGSLTDSYAYGAFGELLDSSGNTVNHYLFAGERLDRAAGLYHLRARDYVSSIGRFMTMDPFAGDVLDPMSLHKYVYAHNDPVNNTDPSGMSVAALATGISGMSLIPLVFVSTVMLVTAAVTACAIVYTSSYLLSQALNIESPGGVCSPPGGRKRERYSMRVQLQKQVKSKTKETHGIKLTGYRDYGVTALQVNNALASITPAVTTQSLQGKRGDWYPIWAVPMLIKAIALLQKRVVEIPTVGGINGHTLYFLQEIWLVRRDEFRIDIDNLAGHNLRLP